MTPTCCNVQPLITVNTPAATLSVALLDNARVLNAAIKRRTNNFIAFWTRFMRLAGSKTVKDFCEGHFSLFLGLKIIQTVFLVLPTISSFIQQYSRILINYTLSCSAKEPKLMVEHIWYSTPPCLVGLPLPTINLSHLHHHHHHHHHHHFICSK